MKVYELDQAGATLIKAIRRVRDAEAERTGLHLSTIIADILGRHRKQRSDLPSDQVYALQEIGNALEATIASELQRKVGWTKPAPRTKDGITCSPDGDKPRTQTIDEMKANWAKWPGDRDVFFGQLKVIGYLMQIKAYCYVWGYTRARLHVLFLTGEKGGAPLPISKTFLLRFDDEELLANWEMIRQHAIDIGLLEYKRGRYQPCTIAA